MEKTEKITKRKQGRPIGSKIRQNIIEILYFYKQLYGYEIYKIYVDIFPAVTMRSIYYHLKKGLAIDEFKIHKINVKEGNYSWGDSSETIVYELSKNARPIMDERVRTYWEKKRK